MQRPLSGIRVIGLEQYMSAPYCTMLLADAGAEVIKVERPGAGDPRRSIPPYADDEQGKTRGLLRAPIHDVGFGDAPLSIYFSHFEFGLEPDLHAGAALRHADLERTLHADGRRAARHVALGVFEIAELDVV